MKTWSAFGCHVTLILMVVLAWTLLCMGRRVSKLGAYRCEFLSSALDCVSAAAWAFLADAGSSLVAGSVMGSPRMRETGPYLLRFRLQSSTRSHVASELVVHSWVVACSECRQFLIACPMGEVTISLKGGFALDLALRSVGLVGPSV